MKVHRRRKFWGKHTTTDKALQEALRALPNIKRAILGYPIRCHHNKVPGTLEERERVSGGVRYRAYDSWGIREVFVIFYKETP